MSSLSMDRLLSVLRLIILKWGRGSIVTPAQHRIDQILFKSHLLGELTTETTGTNSFIDN